MALQEKTYKCAFCERTFTRESWYKKHSCPKKQKFLDANNITIIRAHKLFNHWQRRTGLLRKGTEKPLDDFKKSPFFSTFVNLAEFTTANYVISPFKYVDWIVDNRIPEKKWCNERDLEQYRVYVRETEDAESQTQISCKNIRVWCADHKIEMPEFFTSVPVGQALNMIRENKLSPWLLFGYEPCLEGLTSRFNGEVMFTLSEHINVPYWLDKVENEVGDLEMVRSLCDEALRT